MTRDDVPGCLHSGGRRALAGGEAGRWQGPGPTAVVGWCLPSLHET